MAWAGLDAVAGELTGQLLAAVRPKGTLIVYGGPPCRGCGCGRPCLSGLLRAGVPPQAS